MESTNHSEKLQRLIVRIKQIGQKKINAWNISEIISMWASLYYKLDVLDRIIKSLENDLDPKNIIIFSKPIILNNANYNISEINLSEDVFSMYKLGLPISVFPNRQIIELNLLFSLYQEVSNEHHKINKLLILQNFDFGLDTLTSSYEIYKKSGLDKAISHVIGSAISKIPDKVSNMKIIFRQIENNYKKKYDKYISERNAIKNIASKLKENYISDFSKFEYLEYFNNFFPLFKNNLKPLVGLYDNDKDKIELLCSQHFNSNENENTLLILESVTHKSPYEIIINGAMDISCVLLAVYLTRLETDRASNLDNKGTLYKKIKLLYEEKLRLIHKNIKIRFLDNMLNQQINFIAEEFEKMLNLYSFEIANIEEF